MVSLTVGTFRSPLISSLVTNLGAPVMECRSLAWNLLIIEMLDLEDRSSKL